MFARRASATAFQWTRRSVSSPATASIYQRGVVTSSTVGKKGNIQKLEMASPPVNFLNIQLIRAVTEKFREAEAAAGCDGIILGSAQRVFSAGLDLKALHGTSPESLNEFWMSFQDMLFTIYKSEKMVVAEISGHCPAGGYMLALCADSRVANKGVKVGLNEAAFGLVAPYFGVGMMTDMVGRRVSDRATCLGTLFDTSENALQLGFVDQVVEDNIQAAAIEECELWLKAPGRKDSKMLIRSDIVKKFESLKMAETARFVKAVTDPACQTMIGMYMASLKKK